MVADKLFALTDTRLTIQLSPQHRCHRLAAADVAASAPVYGSVTSRRDGEELDLCLGLLLHLSP